LERDLLRSYYNRPGHAKGESEDIKDLAASNEVLQGDLHEVTDK